MNLNFQKSSPSTMNDVPSPAVDQVEKAASEDVEQPRLAPPPGFQVKLSGWGKTVFFLDKNKKTAL